MAAAQSLGLFTSDPETGSFAPTEAGLLLQHGTEDSMAAFVEMINDEVGM